MTRASVRIRRRLGSAALLPAGLVVVGWLAGYGSGGGGTDVAPSNAPRTGANTRVEAAWELAVTDVASTTVGMAAFGEDLVLLGSDLVVVTKDGGEKMRRTLETPFSHGRGIGSGLLLLLRQTGRALSVSRYDLSLERVNEKASPNGVVSSEDWAPGPTSTWFLARRSLGDVSSVEVAELPFEGPARTWTYSDWPARIYVLLGGSGIMTEAGVPMFFAHCAVNGIGTACALRVNPATGELTSLEVEQGKTITAAWMAEAAYGVAVLYRRIDRGEPFAASFHGVLLDPIGPSILAGPNLLFTDTFDQDIGGLAILGNRAYTGGLRGLFAFDATTMTDWTRYELSFPENAIWESSFGVTAIHDELYRFVGFQPFGGAQSVLVQKLVPPAP
jgi:hypothetical protein